MTDANAREGKSLSEWGPIDMLQAALEAVSDYETPRHAREMAEDMMPTITMAGWQIVRIPPQETEGGHG